MIEQRVTLRYGAQQIPAIVQAVQGDTGRDVIFELADYEIPTGATANYYIDKPDGNAIYNSAEVISSTEILAHLTEQALAAPGRNNGQVRILSDGEVITSFDFVLEVEVFRGLMRMQSETEVNIFDEALQAAAEDAIAEIQAQTPVVTGMQASIAPLYSSSNAYAAGDYVMYNAQLYKCKTAITTPEAWTAAHWTQIALGSDTTELRRVLALYNTIDSLALDGEFIDYPTASPSYVWIEKGTCAANGTASSTSFNGIYNNSTGFPIGMKAGGKYTAFCETTDQNLYLEIRYYPSGSSSSVNLYNIKETKEITIPSDAAGLNIRLRVSTGTTVNNAVIKVAILTSLSNAELKDYIDSNYVRADVLSENSILFLPQSKSPQTADGISFTWDKNYLNVSGTAIANTYYNLVQTENGTFPNGINVSDLEQLVIDLDRKGTATRNTVYVQYFIKTTDNQNWHDLKSIKEDTIINLLSIDNLTDILFRIYVPNGSSVNGSIKTTISNRIGNFERTKEDSVIKTYPQGFAQETGLLDVNNMLENGVYLLDDGHEYINKPNGMNIGFIMSIFTGGWRLQLGWKFSEGYFWKRRGNIDGTTWEQWQDISGGGGTVNEYTFNEYSQTVSLTSSPEITADTNNYLAPSGDTTDRTSDILTMLSTNGVCRLGPGDYYVNNLQMPNGSSLIGCGYSTKLILSGSSDGYAVKMGDYCLIEDLRIIGAVSAPTHTSTPGGRHGILWQGTYTADHGAPYKSIVNNVHIENFTGGGITCYDTGYGTSSALEVTNAYINGCWAGLNISYWSEFHKFTNVRCGQCRIGCVNNGGNNIFVNCDFSSNYEIAMLMDNSQNQSPNNTHGSAIGCVFNHTQSGGQSNSGIGIEILNCKAGFVFSGCQIFFSRIHLEDSDGITVSNCNFGESNCDIEISGGGTILFIGNQHQNEAPITIVNNDKVHFVNCYNRSTGALIEP